MFELSNLLLLALATWRLSYMLVEEDGPAQVFDRLRGLANRTGIGDVFACVYCMSVWVALLLLTICQHPAGVFVVQALAISAGAIIIHRLIEKRRVHHAST